MTISFNQHNFLWILTNDIINIIENKVEIKLLQDITKESIIIFKNGVSCNIFLKSNILNNKFNIYS